jgi:palmitoyltransferase
MKYSKTFETGCLANFVVCLILNVMIVWSHYKASKSDPGFITKTEYIQLNSCERLCKKCGASKTELVHHCSSCDRCVFLMDHHCWWTNNCVGYNSFKSFYLFSVYVMLLTIFGITTIIRNIYSTN